MKTAFYREVGWGPRNSTITLIKTAFYREVEDKLKHCFLERGTCFLPLEWSKHEVVPNENPQKTNTQNIPFDKSIVVREMSKVRQKNAETFSIQC